MMRKLVPLLLFLFSLFPAAGELFWENPDFLTNKNSFFADFLASEEMMYTVWEEYFSAGGERGTLVLKVRRSRDGKSWEDIKIPAAPFSVVGEPVKYYSAAVDKEGNLFLALSSSASLVSVYKVASGENVGEKLSEISTGNLAVSPRLFAKEGGGFLLFVTQDYETEFSIKFLSIFYAQSEDGRTWSDLEHFVEGKDSSSFLPFYRHHKGRDYVVFQNLFSGKRNTYQLYVKISEDNGQTWSEPLLMTDFEEFLPGYETLPEQFDNQRPYLGVVNDELVMVWERFYTSETAKIYYGKVTPEGRVLNSQRITEGVRLCSYPKVTELDGTAYILWFDNNTGNNNVVLAEQVGDLWQEKVLSSMQGSSVFGSFVVFKGQMRVFWENHWGSRDSLVLLNPDNTVNIPFILSPYAQNRRYNRNRVSFSWRKPSDSSGILGYSYAFNREEEFEAPEELMALANENSASFSADEDGSWYFHLRCQDYAGNWSDTVSYSFFRDTTPPGLVSFVEPDTDESGFLSSNTFSLKWEAPSDEDVAGYSTTYQYVGREFFEMDYERLRLKDPSRQIQTTSRSRSFRNNDDGYWALSVRAIDSTGNPGNVNTLFFRLNKYIPVTYISYVTADQNDYGQVRMTIVGRGFKVGGDISTVILDRDGKEPWDYSFDGSSGVFKVLSDRKISGPDLDDIEGGTYRVGIIHPQRGRVFTGPVARFETTGTVKFGDFSKPYSEVWKVIKRDRFLIQIEDIIFFITVFITIAIFIISLFRLVSIRKEAAALKHDARALVYAEPFLFEKEMQRMMDMKKKGIGLRVKFTFSILGLLAASVLLISVTLGLFMIDTQKESLAKGLENQAEIFLNTLSSSASTYLPLDNSLDLAELVKNTSAMEDALHSTITGHGRNKPENMSYLWATNNPRIGEHLTLPGEIDKDRFKAGIQDRLKNEDLELVERLYSEGNRSWQLKVELTEEENLRLRKIFTDLEILGSWDAGLSLYTDGLDPQVEKLAESINRIGTEAVGKTIEELDRLSGDLRKYALRSDAESRRILGELQETDTVLRSQIAEKLSAVSSEAGMFVEPAFAAATLGDHSEYVFYKPLIYWKKGSASFYRGTIRLSVTTENIIQQIEASQQSLIYRVAVLAAIALGLGLIGSLLMSTVMINPIKKLVQGIEVIRDTDDKSALKGHKIDVKSRDELFVLADTVNQMTDGLVKAAAVNKDVTLGKEVQKMFIPLEKNPMGEGKLSTGEFSSNKVSIFGYYEGAKGVSGDYFDYRELDDKHYAMIKCDIAGKGVPASLIMVEVATIFLNYFRDWSYKTHGYNLEKLIYGMNDMIEERGFKGRFAALIVVILNTDTGECHMCNAGDNLVHIYRNRKKAMETLTLQETPAAGVFPSMMVEMQMGFKREKTVLERNDIMFLFTDGMEEAKRLFRDENYNKIICEEPGLKEGELHVTHALHEEFEELGAERIDEIMKTMANKEVYHLKKYHYPEPDATFTFDFTNCEGSEKEMVMALISIEKVFRLNPNPNASKDDVVKMDRVVDDFLKKYFVEYSQYYKFRFEKEDNVQHVFFTHIQEDEQYDDLTILAVRKV